MDKLSIQRRAAVLQCLCEGNSIASTTRITGTAKTAILDLLAYVAPACEDYADRYIQGLTSSRIEMDEIWSFVRKKSKGSTNGQKAVVDPKEGDVWIWKCLCVDSRLIVGYHIGGRTFENATAFCRKVAPRFAQTPEVNTDGLTAYQLAVGYAFGEVDYAKVVKLYGKNKEGQEICTGIRRERVYGNPDTANACTSYIERANLTLRMQNRRFTRRTNAHSKTVTNHARMLAIGFFHYNFVRRNQSVRATPAVAAGIASKEWSMAEMVEMADNYWLNRRESEFEEAFAAMGSDWRK